MEEKLPGVCMVYEDFCNLYEANNAKMLNLVMVLVYCDKDSQEVKHDYYDTFCRGSFSTDDIGDLNTRGSGDHHVYREVWLAAFQSGIFKPFHTLTKTGDNGSSLKSYATLYMHSVLMAEYNIRIIYFTLCPYHAENHCDAAGDRSKKAIVAFEHETGQAVGSASHTAAARNASRKTDKVKKAKGIEAIKEYTKYMPEAMISKKQKHWPYSLTQCCVVFLQVTD